MGIIDWTIDDTEQLNINALKMLSMTVTSTQTVILIIYMLVDLMVDLVKRKYGPFMKAESLQCINTYFEIITRAI